MGARLNGIEVLGTEQQAPAAPLVVRDPALPKAQGLYDPRTEKDSCGVGFIADMKNRASHDIVQSGLRILENLDHRGAVGADPKMGDGCGILVQIPHGFFSEECARLGFQLPGAGQYGVGHVFMPQDAEGFSTVERIITDRPGAVVSYLTRHERRV